MTKDGDIRAHARGWLAWVDAGHKCPQKQKQFEDWLCADPRHRATYIRLEQSWRRADQLSRLLSENRAAYDPGIADRLFWKLWHQPQRMVAGAATLTVVAIAVAVVLTGQRTPQWQDFSSALGAVRTVPLSDGSKIVLNTQTKIQVRLTSAGSYVRIVQGEALFEVNGVPNKPFTVEVGRAKLKVLGTKFSVRLNENSEIDVLMSAGRVKVEGPKEDVLEVGDEALFRDSSVQIRHPGKTAVEHRLAWINGEIIFDGVTLEEAILEMNRYNSWQIKVADARTGALRVGGSYKTTAPRDFVTTLEKAFEIQAIYSTGQGSDGGVILLKRSPSRFHRKFTHNE